MPASDSDSGALAFSHPDGVKHVPLRTCIATRKVLPRSQLLRCVAQHNDDGTIRIVADPAGRLPGRGAWLLPTEAALATAIERKAFHRALRLGKATIDTADLRGAVHT